MNDVELILALLVAVAALAARLNVPYPILLVIGGAALGFIPGLPPVRIAPDVVFLLFVPPLVFAAGFFTSWRDFSANAAPILSLAVGLVVVTAIVVAVVAHLTVGMTWGPAFVLGAVVSSTDTTAVVAIARQTNLPRRIVTLMEGESLVNDAVSLTSFRLAVVATASGVFSPRTGGADLALAVGGALATGWVVGWLTAAARGHSGDPRITTIVSIITPYAAFLSADRIGASGILAVVVAGLYVGRRESAIEDAQTRLETRAVWDVVIFALNGLLFILVGLQLRPIWDALQGVESTGILGAAAAVTLAVVLTRIVWVAVTVDAPLARRRVAGAEPRDSWRGAAVVSWAGLRGGSTLAAALSVPLLTNGGAPFPFRAEIVFLAFAVIVTTLVGQGLTLPLLIRRLGVAGDGVEIREEVLARQAAAAAALGRLDAIAGDGSWPAHAIATLRERFEHEAALLADLGAHREQAAGHVASERRLRQEVLRAEREAVVRLRDEGEISDQVLRRVGRDIDLEEARVGG
ncbi:MAG: Na+/H+ antiporter [Thermomicrobiales bacterium]|nr:Na+/H+ antiporter [Thermomicrobiales bacterium]